MVYMEKEMATYSSILTSKVPWTEGPGRVTVDGVTKSWAQLSDFIHSLTHMECFIQVS